MTARSVPERLDRCQRSRDAMSDSGVLAFVGGDGRDLRRRLAVVDVLLVALERGHQVRDRLRSEEPSEKEDDGNAGPGPRRRRGYDRAALLELARPDIGVTTLVAGNPMERGRTGWLLLDPRQPVVEQDRVAFEPQVVEALVVLGGHGSIVPGAASRAWLAAEPRKCSDIERREKSLWLPPDAPKSESGIGSTGRPESQSGGRTISDDPGLAIAGTIPGPRRPATAGDGRRWLATARDGSRTARDGSQRAETVRDDRTSRARR